VQILIKKASATLALVRLIHNLYFKVKIKNLIVCFACSGFMADWFIQSGGVNHE